MTKAPSRLTSLLWSSGLFATLRGPLGTKGTGAPSPRRVLVTLAVLATTLGALVFASAPALAATPEEPVTREAKSITGSSAVLNGELNPGATDLETEEYQFAYAPSGSECTGGLVAPEPAAIALGDAKEAVSRGVTGLEGSTEYAFCVVAINTPLGGSPEPAYGSPLTFKTLAVAPQVDGVSSSGVTPFEASVEAQVNPENQASTSCVFEYGESTTYGKSVPCAQSVLEGSSDTPATASLTGLKASTKYHYRVAVKNATGETKGVDGEFTTLAAVKPAVETEGASGVTPFEATLEAQVNPEYQETTYSFEYSTTKSGTQLTGTVTPVKGGTLTGGAGRPAGASTGAVLTPNTTYFYRVIATNATGKTEGAIEAFKTLPAEKPSVEPQSTSGVTPFEATLEAQVNPDYQETTYSFAYSSTKPVGETLEGTVVPVTGGTLTGDGAQPVNGSTGAVLKPGTTYYYRVIATNKTGKTEGKIESFSTPPLVKPAVESESSSGVTPFEATLETTVNPEYQETSCEFVYGTEAKLEHDTTTVPCEPAHLGSGGGGVAASLALKGLTPGTTYYYRVLATNATGTTTAPVIEEFKTPALAKPTIEGESVSGVTPLEATLQAQIDPDYQATTTAFEYATEESVVLEGKGTKVSAPSIAAVGPGQPVSAELGAVLQPGTKYYYRVIATNPTGTSENTKTIATFTTEAATAPTVEQQSVTEVSTAAATLSATVNPGGLATTYTFELAPPGGAFAPVTAEHGSGSLPKGTTGLALTVQIEGLAAGTAYQFRVTAHNSVNTAPVTPVTFTTQSSGAPTTLLDNRQYEMVSPPKKYGAGIEAMNYAGGALQAAEDGSGITYWASGPIIPDPVGNTAFENTQVLSKREAPGVWSSQDLAIAHKGVTTIPVGIGSEYKLFSSNLSGAVLEPHGETLLPAPSNSKTQEQTIYLRDDLDNAYQPLVNEADVAPGAHLGELFGGILNRITFAGASPDLEHILFTSVEPLAVAEPGVEPAATPGSKNVYEWSGEPGQLGTVRLVSLLPHGEKSSPGSTNEPGDEAISGASVVRDVISSDGSRVVWTKDLEGNRNLYVTDMAKHESILVASEGSGGSGGPPNFQGANRDGTRVFFTDTEALTPGADPSRESEEGDLYVFEVPRSGGPLVGKLQDLTVDRHEVGGQKENGNMLGYLMGYGAEGSGPGESMTVYFVDSGVLASNKGPAGQEAISGGNNLYVERLTGGVWQAPHFIAALPLADARSWGGHVGAGAKQYEKTEFRNMTAGVSASGGYLAFLSSEPLTGFDDRDAASGVRDQEVFLYDAATDRLVCASCNEFGVRPRGGGSVPGWYANINNSLAEYEPRFLSDSGRLFFDSSDALVPGDSNGRQDVYEYEPAGVGPESARCGSAVSSQDVLFKPAHAFAAEGFSGEEPAGCVGLISSGTSSEESTFLDAGGMGKGGEEAEDVFFLTKSQLAPQDIDSAFDVYDAHECSTAVPCASGVGNIPPACSDADSCRAAPALQPGIYGAPSSATFAGPGNPAPAVAAPVVKKALTRAQKLANALKVCKKKPKKQRAGCEAKARRSYGPLRKAKTKRRSKS